MVEKIKKISPNPAIIKCRDYELKEGDKKSSLWIIEIDDKIKGKHGKNRKRRPLLCKPQLNQAF
jgi:dolichyl-phosphate-mannose--protein O-mannosyl transferase